MENKVIFGIDLGGTTIKMGLFGTEGESISDWEIPTRTEGSGRYILADMAEAVKKTVAERNIARARWWMRALLRRP